jgi:hypothetical protein
MARYLISFDDGALIIPEEELPEVSKAAHAVVDAAKDAGVWIHGGGVINRDSSLVGTDGTVTAGPHQEHRLGGFAIVDVADRAEAEAWAAKFAVACRCAQLVRELMPDPDI